MLAMLTNRAALISWTRALDTESVYRHHLHVDSLFEAPPFNWTYDYAVYQQDKWDRFNVSGFGLEGNEARWRAQRHCASLTLLFISLEYVEQEPLHRLFCSDVMEHMGSTVWWEVYWRYGFVGQLLYHSPYLHRRADKLFVKVNETSVCL